MSDTMNQVSSLDAQEIAGQELSPGGAGAGIVRAVLAAILLLAAGLKAHQLATQPVVGDGLLFLSGRGALIAELECEIILGVWLLAGEL